MKYILKKIKVSELKENPKNPRRLTEKGLKDLESSIKKFGIAEPIICNKDLMICGGHGRKKILERLNILEVDCYISEKQMSEKDFNELGVRLNKNIAGEFDFDILANEFELEDLLEWGFEDWELGLTETETETETDLNQQFYLNVKCENETEQSKLYNKMLAEGYEVKIIN
jgi:hypothetical protein